MICARDRRLVKSFIYNRLNNGVQILLRVEILLNTSRRHDGVICC
jgi:hypothetical protein